MLLSWRKRTRKELTIKKIPRAKQNCRESDQGKKEDEVKGENEGIREKNRWVEDGWMNQAVRALQQEIKAKKNPKGKKNPTKPNMKSVRGWLNRWISIFRVKIFPKTSSNSFYTNMQHKNPYSVSKSYEIF